MIIILKPGANKAQVGEISLWIEEHANVSVNPIYGSMTTILGLVGDTSSVDMGLIQSNELVEAVKRVSEPYKKANRKFHPDDTVLQIGDLKLGGDYFQIIAGPCSVESEEQILEVARNVHNSGAKMLRGGAFKPRTSPYSFQGMRAEGTSPSQSSDNAHFVIFILLILSIFFFAQVFFQIIDGDLY